jgi:hypothetical protein
VGITGNLTVGNTVVFSGLNIGTTGAGSTAVFIAANGTIYKNILGAGAFGNGIGTTYAAGNGVTLAAGNIFKLGGTLSESTQIGTSNYSLSFIGLGGTQSLFVGASGFIGIGTTNPTARLYISQIADTNSGGLLLMNSGGAMSQRLWIDSANIGHLDMGSGGTGNLAINGFGTGYVGIGTTAPDAQLQVVGTLHATGLLLSSGATVTSILDEDDMASASAVASSASSFKEATVTITCSASSTIVTLSDTFKSFTKIESLIVLIVEISTLISCGRS